MEDGYWLADQDPDTLTDEVLEKWLRGNVETLYHAVSSLSRVLRWEFVRLTSSGWVQ